MRAEYEDKEKLNVVGSIEIKCETFTPTPDWIRAKVKETKCPLFYVYLQYAQVASSLSVRNSENGMGTDIVEFLKEDVDVIKYCEERISFYEEYLSETGREHCEEYRIWLDHLSNQFSAMPGARSLQIRRIISLSSVAAVFHEAGHVKLKHIQRVDDSDAKGVKKILKQESAASDLALKDFADMINYLSIDSTEILKAKRLLDALYYSYVAGFQNQFKNEKFNGIRELDISEEEQEIVREMYLFLVEKLSYMVRT